MQIECSHFLIAFHAVVPVFVLIGIGLYIRYKAFLTPAELKRVNHMVFQIFFFTMMFYNVYTTNMGEMFRPKLVCFSIIALFVVYAISFVLVCWKEKAPKRRGAMIQAMYRSNFVLVGLPLISNIFGSDKVAVTTMMIAIIVPLYNIIGVVTLEIFRGGKCSFWHLVQGVLKNAMIRGSLLGFILLVLHIEVPPMILRPLGQIAAATTPLALMILGASFSFGSTKAHMPQLIACVVTRLVLVPAAVLGAAAYLGFRGVEFATLISIFTTPCAVAGFTMAQQLDSDADLAGNAVVFSTAFSAFTVFGWIVIAKAAGMF